jgi:hypothetical protein
MAFMEPNVAVNETAPPNGGSLLTTRLASAELVLVDLADAGAAVIPRTPTATTPDMSARRRMLILLSLNQSDPT